MTAATTDAQLISEPGVYDLPVDAAQIRVEPGHVATVDAADVDFLTGYRWRILHGHNGKLYAYANVSSPDRTVYMHRLIVGTPDGVETDHRNGDGLDNRRLNLRVASASQNRANMGKPHRPGGQASSSQYKGVSWDTSRHRWQSKISRLDPVTGRTRTTNLGRYDSEVSAAIAYDLAALSTWGEYARLNFPVPAPRRSLQ